MKFKIVSTFLKGLFALTLLVAVTGHGLAQQVGVAKTVRSIDVQYVGSPTVTKDRILSRLSTKVGAPFSQAKVDEDIKKLYAGGDVENIRILAEPQGDTGVRLIVVVQTRALLGDVVFTGNAAVTSKKLNKKVDLTEGESIDVSQIQEGRSAIQEVYRKNGYPEVSVSYDIGAPNKQGFSTLTYTVDEGGKGVLRKIEFIGNDVFKAKELRKQMEQKQKGMFSMFSKKGRIDEDKMADDVRHIEDYYQDSGYLNAQVVDVRRVRVDEKYIDLVITIDEGEVFSVGDVNLKGVRVMSPDTDVSPYIQVKPGETYSGTKLKSDVKMIRDLYGSQGYADARVEPQLTGGEGEEVNVSYAVTEGRKFNLGKINISGNQKTQDKVIRREMAVHPGEIYDTVRIDATQARLMNLNYFSSVDVLPVDTSYIDVKDLNITVTEKPTGTVNFGAGFSSIDSLVGFVDVTQSNFDLGNWPSMTGAGQKFRMNLRYGTQRRDFLIGLTEPWFMGHRLAVGGELYYRDLFFLSDYFDQSEYGGTMFLRKPIGKFAFVRAEYRLQSVEISADNDASPTIQSEEGTFIQSMVAATLVHDTRNSLFLPRNGHKLSAGLDYSGLGGDVETYGLQLSGAQYFDLPFDTIFSVVGALNSVDGSGDVPIFEREFMGGANNLRGFDFREVGPKDINGEAIGGQTSWFTTAEVTFPLMEKIRGALFYDVGAVSRDPWDLGGTINSNYGLGLRLFILGGAPIQLDYGIPMQADEFNDSGGRFQFTMGYRF
ncbi:MAG: outer membrane protein assembly factor BamA [Verrucomicrobiales bacterium]|nr:outer membrane protein assembly factor BamA [Verrucomicrobiales bacterium]